MADRTTRTLGRLVTETPGAARVFERHGLDYCCGGQRSLGEACAEGQVDSTDVLDEIAALHDGPAPDWPAMGPSELVDHLEATHHHYLNGELPRLSALAAKVEGVHGGHHPELADVRSTLEALRDDLEPHLMKEERVLFPMIRELAASDTAPSFHCGTLRNPIGVMAIEHDRAGELLTRLRDLTGGYQVPDDGCASYRMLYVGLEELEADTHLHIHKENNLLFPAVMKLEEGVSER
jgi:regulator of cell morphogenesis and NO signaling